MRRRAEIGAAAFDTEYQGIPSVEGLTEFPAEYFDRPEVWFADWPAELVYRVQSLDPSKGADAKSGDYQGHILLGMDRWGKTALIRAAGRVNSRPRVQLDTRRSPGLTQ